MGKIELMAEKPVLVHYNSYASFNLDSLWSSSLLKLCLLL